MDWDARYRSNDTPWLRPDLNPAFAGWFSGSGAQALSGLRVLVPGFGTSPEPLALARLGAGVVGIDIAPAALGYQQTAFMAAGLKGDFALADMASWRPDRPVDAIYEQTCLCAIEPSQRPAYAAFAHAALKPGGRLYALFMQNTLRPGGPPFHCDLADMRELFPADRWGWPTTAPVRSEHPNGMHELGFILSREP